MKKIIIISLSFLLVFGLTMSCRKNVQEAPPPPPQASAPPPPASGGDATNRNVMIALAYLGPFALIPLLVEKDDREVQWHAKHGLVLMIAWIVLFIVIGIVGMIPVIGCLAFPLYIVVPLGLLILHVVLIVKGINGERFKLPVLSDFADRF